MLGLRTLCVLLCVLGADGRGYPGRKRGVQKHYSTAMQRYRQGPHICQSRYGNGCCLGWSPTLGSGQCIIPVCSFGCGNGYCVAPNLCFCRGGQQGVSCSDDGRSTHYLSDSILNHSDIDGNPPSCLNMHCDQSCALIGGMPVCSCYGGYSLGKDGKTCYDVDECSRYGGPSLCQQICKNNIGSYRCLCYQGYQLLANGRTCITSKYLDLTGLPGLCGEYGCDMSCNHGGCEEISRVCPVGFIMIETSNGVSCKDLDECTGNRSPCQQRCQNVVGSFICSCQPGFHLHNNGHSCTDVNECRWIGESRVCHHSCHNTVGSYLCFCRSGFRLLADRSTCEDVNECENSNCSHHCVNTVGSFQCLCPRGYTQHVNGRNCQDNNECATSGDGHCAHNCINTAGSYYCTCHPGYRLHFDRHSCISDGACQSCQSKCFPGFSLLPNGVDCTDIDECLSGLCSHHCVNTEGSFYCTCPEGFHLNMNNTCTGDYTDSDERAENIPNPAPVMESLQQPLPAAIYATPWTPPTSCWYNGTLQEDGANWTVSECVDCTCQLGTVSCTTCPSLPCSKMELVPGLCCPVCKSCLYNGSIHSHNSSWVSLSQPCLTCSCQEGEVFCQPIVCETSCSHQVPEEGQCCGTCDKCLYEGLVVNNEDVFSPSNDNCTLCVCILGNVTCITPECRPVTCQKPTLLDCCPTCPAECMDQGIVYPHGAEFTRPGVDCINCACLNGEVECSYSPCPVLDCARENWFLEPGKCCFTCRQDKTIKGCFIDDNGIEFPVGQIWSPGDPCEVCVCQADGSIVCKRTDCFETCAHPILVPGQCCPDCSAGCAYDGVIYQNNETFPSSADSCLTCICLSGSAACSPVECKARCTYPFHSEGECCPLCIDCNYEGRKVTNGQSFQPENSPCSYCKCQLGEVSCDVLMCEPPSCEHPYSVPGECCPSCSVCLYDGQILEAGGYYISATDPCIVCLCMEGNMECDWKGDSCTELECEEPLIHVPGSCCPMCPDCCVDEDGAMFSHGESVPREDLCTRCLCLDTQISCSFTRCSIQGNCINPVKVEGQCCPLCQGCLFNGVSYTNGSQFIPHGRPCIQCHCSEGTVMCRSQKEICPPLQCSLMQQETPEGQCCPVCVDSLCMHQDQIHEAQSQWLHGCDLCHCNNGTVACQPKPCSPPVSCPAQSILPHPNGECCVGCLPKPKPRGASCTLFGESHYMTFDGHFYDFNGTCAYLLAQDCESNRFNVVYQSKWRDSSPKPGTKALIVQIENRTIELSDRSQVRVDNTDVELPYIDETDISIQHSGLYAILKLPEGLSITWDGKSFVEIHVTESLQSRMCGLCGNFNGNSSDDFVLPGGEEALSPIDFGNSWLTRLNKDTQCIVKDIEDPCNGTTLADNQSTNSTCSIIMGPLFEAAHESVDPQPYYRACLTDLCGCVEQTWCLCNILSAYAFRALRNGIILNWRNETLCGASCNGGSQYNECSCPQTCSTHLRSEIWCSTATCMPGCQCPAGLLMHQSNCLPPSLCPTESVYSHREASSLPSL
ncbi:kielin/chordin-like protein isoform X9 [Scyliorhinus canicula]|uniref:kielin/chordin-like protein isoform X9 n=1 Tax=Scyliorhinus canicula TaxID=7830 RepID=UPI0018F7392E|nr:kielin/chordin-like protein isoform X9 [Scyliorhinus canicula]